MSRRNLLIAAVAGLSSLGLTAPTMAAVALVTPAPGAFVEQLTPQGANAPGVYGVEARGGRPAAQDWEIGVGRGTSQPGNFNQGEYNWISATTDHAFTLDWTASGIVFKVGALTVTDAGKTAPLPGNTLKIFVKGISSITVAAVDGTVFNNTFGSNQTAYFYSANNFGGDGFKATGTLRITPNGGSQHEVMFKAGTLTVVPEPATWAMMILGFGAVGSLMRHRRRIGALA